MSERRPYMNPETGEVKMLTEEEAEALNKEEEAKERASALKKEMKEVPNGSNLEETSVLR